MIYLFTALYMEAELFIKQFHLEKNLENTRFQEFYQEKAGIRLAVTGVGEIAAAAAVSSICTAYKPKEGDVLLNIGTCAHLAGKKGVFVCSKIIEQATGKTFYPDLLFRHGLQEETIVTGMLPCSQDKFMVTRTPFCNRKESMAPDMLPYNRDETMKTEIPICSRDKDMAPVMSDQNDKNGSEGMPAENLGGNLYDMEAAAVYQAGSYYFGPHQMMFLKVVSDAGMADAVSKEELEHLMETDQDVLFHFIEKISAIYGNQQIENTLQQENIQADALCTDLHCSKVMRDSLRQHIHYWELAGTDYVSVIQNMYREGLLPCRDKREGKLRFEELKRRLF